MSLTVTSYPTQEPITLDEIKEHLNIDYEIDEYDGLLEAYISAARQYCEKRLGRRLINTTYEYKIKDFASEIELPVSPVISIDSITYIDINSSPNRQTVTSTVYGLDSGVHPPVVYLEYGQSWPSNRGARNDVIITLTAGYQDTQSSPRDLDDRVPQNIKQAIKLIVGEFFLVREQTTDIQTYRNKAADALLDFDRSWGTCV